MTRRFLAHELGHIFNANLGNAGQITPYSDLGHTTILDDIGGHVTGIKQNGWQRTMRGYTAPGVPAVYHGQEDWPDSWNTPSENFADMFLNWACNSFNYSSDVLGAGHNRYNWMATNMSTWISRKSR
jgi:hypothetical protein